MYKPPNKFLLPVTVSVRSSITMYLLYVLAITGGFAGIWASGLVWSLQVLSSIGLLIYTFMVYKQFYEMPRELVLKPCNSWQVCTHDGEKLPASLVGEQYVYYKWLIIQLYYKGCAHIVILTTEEGNEDSLRLLRVRLKHPYSVE